VGVRGKTPISGSRVTKASYIWAAAYFAAAAMTASAQTTPAATPQQNAGVDQAQIDQGKVTFAQKCSHCHGPNMINGGTIAPDLRRFPDDRERFFTAVKLGKNNKMPPWGDLLDDDQIACLWTYISSRRNP
jgi:mono/diheme cytochrome c family protein